MEQNFRKHETLCGDHKWVGILKYLILGVGSLGSLLAEYLGKKESSSEIRLFDNHEYNLMKFKMDNPDSKFRYLLGDIRDKERLNEIMKKIDVCIHTVALKHIDLCENNPFESINVNVLGTQYSIEAAVNNKIDKFLYVSTDKAVNAASIYGRCKALSESLIVEASRHSKKTRFAVARFPNFKYSSGNVIELWNHQKAKGEPLTVTDINMKRFFISKADIIDCIMKSLKWMKGGEIFIPTKTELLNILDLAKTISSDIKIIGMRAGERLFDPVMTEDEQGRAVEKEDILIINRKER